jgi:GT2 family glycosyltransferase
MAMSPIVSIIIQNKNEKDNVIECLDAIRRSDKKPQSIQIIIVDIKSTDDSVAVICRKLLEMKREGFLDPMLIETETDKGGPEAYERAFAHVCQDYAYLMKMDNDLLVDPRCLSELMKMAESDERIGFVGGKVYMYRDGPTSQFHLIGNYFGPFIDAGKYVGALEEDEGQYDKAMELGALHGAMLLVKRSVIEKIGLMDTDYFLYHDDLDWCYRGKKAGFKVMYVPTAKGWHKVSPNRGTVTNRFMYHATRSTIIFARKHYGYAHFALYYIYNLLFLQRALLVSGLKSKRYDVFKVLAKANADALLSHLHKP